MAHREGKNFPAQVTCRQAGTLLFEELNGTERLSEPYSYDLSVLSEQGDLKAEKVLGQSVTVSVELPRGGHRRFNGLISRCVYTGETLRAGNEQLLHRYRFHVQPWFWFLTRAADCRIYQNKKVPDIVSDVFKRRGFSDFELHLQGTYDKRDYCVQYRETDFNFVSRLLEESGIFYYFRHQADKHVMVLADDPAAHRSSPPYDKVTLRHSVGQHAAMDAIERWWVERAVQPGAYQTTDFDFRSPTSDLYKQNTRSRAHALANFPVYDYPALPAGLGGPAETEGGAPVGSVAAAVEAIAKVRLEELQSGYERFHGRGNCLGLATGAKFTLTEAPSDLAREYAIVATAYTLTSNQFVSGGESEFEVSVAVEAADAKTVFRPPRRTPKPVIQGAQTAMVVGKSGEEIDADKYGRVKVQFPWDREGRKDQDSSCWVRVAQVWAGKNWGAIHIPRIGQEVLVDFLEGDPDRPIVTGRVYNAESMPPYALPENVTQSGIKSRSSKGGSEDNCNELRFEDKKGSELLLLHAEKDMTTEVEHDRKLTVGNDSATEVKHDRTITIGHDETRTIKNDHSTTIQGKEKRDVTGKRTTTVNDDDSLTANANRTLKVAMSYKLTADEQITLQSGASKLVMKADGTIELTGVKITIHGDAQIKESAAMMELSADAQLKASAPMVQVQGNGQTQIQGAVVQVQGSGMLTLQGGVTMIG
ncbi:MAG: type VI secretion system tip protein VgrG [Gammaproteobacteria bacterium]|nr:type VI secretion system tip protein VgrG [Gammaproteobacteria bacterium]